MSAPAATSRSATAVIIGACRASMHGSERGPSEQRALVGRIPASSVHAAAREDRSTIRTLPTQQAACSAVSAIDAGCSRVEPETEHEVGRVEALVEDRRPGAPVSFGCEGRQERRSLGENGFRRVLVRGEKGVDEPDPCRASGHQQVVDIAMIELQRDLLRRQAEADRPAVDVEGRNRRDIRAC